MQHAKFGIKELDDYLGGGLDRDSLSLIIGRSGIGKTILSAHWAAEGARNDETVVYITTTLNRKSCESYLKKFSFMEDVYDKIHWRFVRIDPKYIMPVTREKIREGLEATFKMPGKDIDRVIFDSTTDLERTLADPVLYRRAIVYMAELAYEHDVTALFVEEAPMRGEWSDTKNIVEATLYLDLLLSEKGYVRAMRILKKYRTSHPLEWIPFEITDDGIKILEGHLVRMGYDYEWRR